VPVKKVGTNLGRSIVIYEKCEYLARDIGYPDIVEHLRVIEWNFTGDYDRHVCKVREGIG